jgi:hypothetical protein
VAHPLDVDDIILNFDPAKPYPRFRTMGLPEDILVAEAALPSPVPWPSCAAPTPAPLAKTPSESAIFSSPGDAVVTTDVFAFDDSTDYYHLQGLGRACDMGDALVANALQPFKSMSWHAIRNASDPQIPNPDNKIEEAKKQSAVTYVKYGGLTTAASLIATWAIIGASR